jgi:hypothetical protein
VKKPTTAERERHLFAVAREALEAISDRGELEAKRPLGNSFIAGDVLEIIGAEPEIVHDGDGDTEYSDSQIEYADELWASWAEWALKRLPRPKRKAKRK